MVLALILFAAFFYVGWKRAERRGGATGDKVQMALAHAIPAGVVGFGLAILLVRSGL